MRHSASPSSKDAASATGRRYLSRTAYASIGAAFLVIITAATVVELTGRVSEGPFNPTCEPWDTAASSAVARLVADTSDAAARQLGDSVFRLRRARKNCRVGWINLACQDYRALIRDTAGIGLATECFSSIVAGASVEARR
jgi:hypothetical protein